MKKFWDPFKRLVADKMESVSLDEAKSARVLGTDPKSGKQVSVRLGRYGPFAQIGLKEDGDTPKYASLRPGQSLHTISLDQAMELFKLPRVLGTDEHGHEVSVAIGRFGPFVKIGSTYASLKTTDDPYTIELPRALEVMREKLEAAANRVIASFDDGAIQVLNGRYGPYVTDGTKNANVPKDREPKEMTRDDCVALLAEKGKPARTGGRGGARRGAPAKKTAARKAPARKAAAKDASAAPAKKAAARKAPAKRAAPAKKAAARKTARKVDAVDA
jgi:DNA topoisomerase-1